MSQYKNERGGGEEPYSSQVEVLNKIFTFNTFNLVGQTGSCRVTAVVLLLEQKTKTPFN